MNVRQPRDAASHDHAAGCRVDGAGRIISEACGLAQIISQGALDTTAKSISLLLKDVTPAGSRPLANGKASNRSGRLAGVNGQHAIDVRDGLT
jgi:hypothetical protein